MERLTHERVNGIKTGYWSAATKEALVQKLAAYENTGLTPEDIKSALTEDAVLKMAGQALGVEPDRLQALTPDLEVVSELEETERGNGGFGSTGR